MERYEAHPVLLEDCGIGVDQVGDVLTISQKHELPHSLSSSADISFTHTCVISVLLNLKQQI